MAGSDIYVHFRCIRGHEWATKAYHRKEGHGCPYCAGYKVIKGVNDLASNVPELVDEWDFDKNKGITPDNAAIKSHQKVWWICPAGHSYKAEIGNRTTGSGCPYCSGKKVLPGFNDLETVSPEVAMEWNYEKNDPLKPQDLTDMSNRKVWWRCKQGHEWEASVCNRKTKGCPYCTNKKILPGFNDLASQRPDIAVEWNLEKNDETGPIKIGAGSHKRVWWKCRKGHEWKTSVEDRCAGTGCPYCARLMDRHTITPGENDLGTLSLSDEQLLMDCAAITPEGITYAALILFGKHAALGKYLPQAEIVFEYRSTDASGPANQREEFREGFFTYYDRIWDLINLRNDKQSYQEGFFIFDIPTFNERVIREAILNAVSHRNYQMGGSIFIRQYRDRLVVESPGGFPFGISLDNILDRQSPRNRRIAEILGLCGLVERSGQGMNIIYELSIKEAKPLPDFTGTDNNFVCLTLNGLIIDKNMLSVINRIGEEQLEILSTNDFLTINALYHGGNLSDSMKPCLPKLVDMGIIEHVGRNKYVLARRLYEAAGKTGIYTRKVGLDRETNKELILKHIRENGKEGTPFKELQQVLPSLSRNEIRTLMRDLQKNGMIYMTGKTSGSRWFAYSEE